MKSSKMLCLAFLLLPAFLASSAIAEDPPAGQLPEYAVPLRYKLEFTVIPDQDRFAGEAEITVQLKEPREMLWVHGRSLNVKEASVVTQDGTTTPVSYSELENPVGVAKIDFGRTIPPGEIRLRISYDAPFDRQLRGLYRVDEAGESYAFTQFQTIFARLCFPGFDEPRFKTPFDLSLIVKKEHVALATTLPLKEEDVEEGLKKVIFRRTEKLPTELIAFAVGNLDVVQAKDIPPNRIRKEGIPFRGVAAKGKGKKLQYAIENTPEMMRLLEEYFEIPYPYHKLDLVAVPDFEAGAMENPGLITYREQGLLLEEPIPVAQRRLFARYTAHELAHMWFGNLVTVRWWDDIWLSESFAEWLGRRIEEKWDPTLEARLDFQDRILKIMETDSLQSARRVRQPIESNHDISNAFDYITYTKGGAILSMFEQYLGPEVFRKAIQYHMRKFSHSTATMNDFLQSLSHVSGKEIQDSFQSFLLQPGIPFIQVSPSCNEGKTTLQLRQSRYLPLGSKADANQVWKTPVCLRYGMNEASHQACFLLQDKTDTFALPENGCASWLIPNADAAGYYRWNLRADDLRKLLSVEELTVAEKISIADSIWASFINGTIDSEQVLQMLEPFALSDQRLLAKNHMKALQYFDEHLVDGPAEKQLETYAQQLYQRSTVPLTFERLEGETEEQALFRKDILSFLAFTAKDPRIRREAKEKGESYIGFKKDGRIHLEVVAPDLVDDAVGVAIQENGEEFYDSVLKQVKKSTDGEFRSNLIYALSKSIDPRLVKRTLELTLDPEIRTNELFYVYAIVRQEENREIVWNWFTANYQRIAERFPEEELGFTPFLASGFCEIEKVDEVKTFFAPHIQKMRGGPRRLAATLEQIELCSAGRQQQAQSAMNFFSALQAKGAP